MARKATGTIGYVPAKPGEKHGHYRARVTCADGSRPWIDLPPGPKSPRAEASAREKAAHYSEQFRAQGIVAGSMRRTKVARARASAVEGENVATWIERWLADRRERGIASVVADKSRLRFHVTPLLGALAMREVSREDIERLVGELDGKVREQALAWKTAANVWTLVTTMFDDACNSKALPLRVLSANPTTDVRGPDRGVRRARTYLYPSEFDHLMRCERVPVRFRRAVALAVYLFPRAGELEALEWTDVDMERGIIHIHRAMDRAEGLGTKATKTGATRRFSVEGNILPLLRTMRDDADGEGHVIGLGRDLSRELRRMLKRAGLERADIHTADETRKPLSWHDLRATGLTWMAVRGDEPLKIMQRAGHTDFATTQLYVREAEAVRDGFGDVFPELPDELLPTPEDDSIVPAIVLRTVSARKNSEAHGNRTHRTTVIPPFRRF